jgi:hypothetical protein
MRAVAGITMERATSSLTPENKPSTIGASFVDPNLDPTFTKSRIRFRLENRILLIFVSQLPVLTRPQKRQVAEGRWRSRCLKS